MEFAVAKIAEEGFSQGNVFRKDPHCLHADPPQARQQKSLGPFSQEKSLNSQYFQKCN